MEIKNVTEKAVKFFFSAQKKVQKRTKKMQCATQQKPNGSTKDDYIKKERTKL